MNEFLKKQEVGVETTTKHESPKKTESTEEVINLGINEEQSPPVEKESKVEDALI